MSPVLKILVGALMMVLGIFTSITYSTQLLELVQGGIGPLLILVGAFIVWLESDELKVQREESSGQQEQEFEKQQTLNESSSSDREARDAAKEIRQAVSTGKEQDNEEILSGTVREVKEEVSDRDDINVRALLEAERSGKNRTTLVDYLERRVD
jgi:hypothetical protein